MDSVLFLHLIFYIRFHCTQLRDTLGGVEYTPTILVVFFHNDGLEIGKVEGDMKIEGAIRTGQMERLMRR